MAMTLATKINSNLRLILLGYNPKSSNSLTSFYFKLIKKYKLEKFIKILPSVPHNKMAENLNSSDIYISASFSDGTSVSLLEAFACGLPVIVTNIAANREWVNNGINGYLFEPGNFFSLAKYMLDLSSNPRLINIMSRNNLDLSSNKANWYHNIEKLEDIYASISNT